MYDYCFKCGRWARIDLATAWCDDCYVEWLTAPTQDDNTSDEYA